jgi:hypothetical protein
MQYDALVLDELSPDSSDYEKDGLVFAENGIPVQSAWRELKGRAVLGTSAATGYPNGKLADASISYVGTGAKPVDLFPESRLWTFDGATWVDRSKGGAAYTATDWNFTKFGPAIIASPRGGALQVRIPPAAAFSDLVVTVDKPRPALLGVVRSVVFGARMEAGGAGVYATADPQGFCWSDRNDATSWTPGLTGNSGFGFLKDQNGEIKGLACYSAFAVIFKDFGVYRLDYIGGDDMFQPSEIGTGGLGLANYLWRNSVVKAGQDIFYFSNLGPTVVYNGTTCQLLGGSKVRRYLTDLLGDYGAQPGFTIDGTYDPYMGVVVWCLRPAKYAGASNFRVLVVTEIKHGSYDAYTVRFSPDEGRWSTAQPKTDYSAGASPNGFDIELLVHDTTGVPATYPLQLMRMIEYTGTALRASSFSDTATSLPITLRSKIWRPSASAQVPDPSRRAVLYGVRPVWRADTNGDPYPVLSILISASNDPTLATGVVQKTVTTASLTDNGFCASSQFPIEAAFFQFDVLVPSMAAASLHELHALELAFEPATAQSDG